MTRPNAKASVLLLGLCLTGFAALTGCGEKLGLLEAQGIPTSSSYREVDTWPLEDPVDLVQSASRLFVIEGATGTLIKYNFQGDSQAEVTGLVDPTAIDIEDTNDIVVVVDGGGANGPRILLFEQGDLTEIGSVDLSGVVQSVAGLAAGDQFVYLSDPDSGVVHRLRWEFGGPEPLVPQGLVCTDQGSIESPQFVSEPSGLALDQEMMLLICDADTLRNWVVRFDPLPPVDDPEGLGRPVVFLEEACPNQPVSAFVLGKAPACGELFEPGPSAEPGGLHSPLGVDVDAAGQIYVADRDNGRIQRFGPQGEFRLSFGDNGNAPLVHPVRVNTFDFATRWQGRDLIIDAARVYVVDRSANEIRVFEDELYSDYLDQL